MAAFGTLSDRLTATFRNLRTKGKLTPADVDGTVREIRRALLDADVALVVVKDFTAKVREPGNTDEKLAALFLQKSRDAWCELLEGSDACVAPVLSMAEAPAHPHNRARGIFVAQGGVVQPAPAPRFKIANFGEARGNLDQMVARNAKGSGNRIGRAHLPGVPKVNHHPQRIVGLEGEPHKSGVSDIA